ncbi:MAG: DGQHR domain-containing protein [Hyphomicrobium sp.]|nr:DGQHR domain-containing protein [Hyphomicrobium sp.]
MAEKSTEHGVTKHGENPKRLSVPCVELQQGDTKLYIFKMKASRLWNLLSINRRDADKETGYQRVLSSARVEAVSSFIAEKNPIPVGIVVSLNEGKFDAAKQALSIPAGHDVGWVIDGQHRLAGAHRAAMAGFDIELAVIAFVGLNEDSQIRQFVTINREGKGVPTSLVLDLLKRLPTKNPADTARERAHDLANELRKDPDSVFYERIAVISSPKSGQISNTNFVRKVAPLVHDDKGILKIYSLVEQEGILENYFRAVRKCFGEEWSKSGTVFFQTIGFGALMNIFDTVFQETLSRFGGFRVADIVSVLSPASAFDFNQWRSKGSGNKAEQEAAADLLVDLKRAEPMAGTAPALKIKLD